MEKGFFIMNEHGQIGDGPFMTKKEAELERDAFFGGQNIEFGYSTDKGYLINK
jgi:hypothetical protein